MTLGEGRTAMAEVMPPVVSNPETSVWGGRQHLAVLDGWRGLSIILVLAGHMLPLGPKWLHLNEAVASAGMAVFFILSGFLITTTLLRDQSVPAFLLKRVFRIVPLLWAVVLLMIVIPGAPTNTVLANLLFYANWSRSLLKYAPHLWSLSIEMQFYVFVALLVAVGGRRALYALPVIGLCVTAARVFRGAVVGVTTFDRVDEILAGATLALILAGRKPKETGKRAAWLSALLFVLLVASTHYVLRVQLPVLAYLRPYFAALLVGLSFSHPSTGYRRLLEGRVLRYVASISYALYVLHPMTYSGWMGSGDTLERYGKRAISFVLTFAGAHFSTRYFERPFTRLGHRLAAGTRTDRVPA